jgi:hypothetical protein
MTDLMRLRRTETRRKPLAFAADAVRYGICTAVWILDRESRAKQFAVRWQYENLRSGRCQGGGPHEGAHRLFATDPLRCPRERRPKTNKTLTCFR